MKSFVSLNKHMNKLNYQKFLESVAEIEPIMPNDFKAGIDKRYEPVSIDYDGEIIDLNEQFNPTLGVRLTAVKKQTKLCEMGCGEMVTGQLIEHKKHISPEPHWRTKCTNCKKVRHPNGQELLDGSSVTINNLFYRWFAARKLNNNVGETHVPD